MGWRRLIKDWSQTGQDIDGDNAGDAAGYSLALSLDVLTPPSDHPNQGCVLDKGTTFGNKTGS